MPLSQQIIDLIRDEIGQDPDYVDNIEDEPTAPEPTLGSLERIYTDPKRGKYNVLRTALICWRRRRNAFVHRSFDVSTAGTLVSRRQRIKEMDFIIAQLELVVETTLRGKNVTGRVGRKRDRAELS